MTASLWLKVCPATRRTGKGNDVDRRDRNSHTLRVKLSQPPCRMYAVFDAKGAALLEKVRTGGFDMEGT